MARPGFTVFNNLDQNDTLARDVLSNLLSSNTTRRFDLDNDLTVFRNNVNSTTNFQHFSRLTQGRQYIIRGKFNHTPNGGVTRTYFYFIDPLTGRVVFNLPANNTFKFASGTTINTTVNSFDYNFIVNSQAGDDPFIFYSIYLSIDATEAATITEGRGDSVTVISVNEESQNYKLEFTDDDKMKISVYYTEDTFTPADTITDVQIIQSNGEVNESDSIATGEYTISDYEVDYETKIKSFILNGHTFSEAEQTDYLTAFNGSDTSIRLVRKNGVTKANLINVSEPNNSLSSNSLANINISDSILKISDDIDRNITNVNIDYNQFRKSPINKLLLRRKENTVFNRDVEISGVVRFKDSQDDVSESDSEIDPSAPGLFLYSGDVNASPLPEIKRAFSEVSNIWTINDATDTIEVIGSTLHNKATIEGELIFVDDIRIDVASNQIEAADSPDPNANGSFNDSTGGLQTGPQTDNTFTHRIILEVEEENFDGDIITEEYSILAIKQ